MKYDKQLFINNLKYLVSYGYEPEVTLKSKIKETVFIIAYKDFVDITMGESTVKLSKVEEILDYVNFDNVVEIECDTINLQLPVQSQSIVVDGKLYIRTYPTELVQKHKKQIKLFGIITLPCIIAVSTYLIITILNCDTFDTSAIVACSVFGGVFVAVGASIVMAQYFEVMNIWQWIGMAVVVVVFGTLGDLVESIRKREMGIMDSGNVLPGHGGLLDRFDSTLFAVPSVIVYLTFIGIL